MTMVTAPDGTQIYVEETGRGDPIVFAHEYSGDHRSWEAQVRHLSRRYRCVTFAARGYSPSDIPENTASYALNSAVGDMLAVMDGLRLEKAHVVGLSMGAFTSLHFGLTHPERLWSIVAAGAGTGSDPDHSAQFKRDALDIADTIETKGMSAFAKSHGDSAMRRPLAVKDSRSAREFVNMLAEHAPLGSINTMRGYQARRPSLYDFKQQFAEMNIPTLLIIGDEDYVCLKPGLFLKQTIPNCGMAVLPRSGHTVNLEEPAAFNALLEGFYAQVEHDHW